MAAENKRIADDQDAEKRAHPRSDIQSDGVIFYEPGARSSDCAIRNISTGGARVVLAEDIELPEKVQIFVGPATYINALIRWRIGLEAGLEFVG